MGKIFTRVAAIVAGLAITAAGLASTEVPAAAADPAPPVCQATFTKYKTVRVGSTGARAKAMECLLTNAGFAATVNGRFSRADGAQLAAFRKSVGLSAKKTGGARAWTALLSRGTRPSLSAGDTGADVLRLQLSLRAAHFKVPKLGAVDSTTVAAVKAAQKRIHQPVTGKVDAKLWAALQRGRIVAAKAQTKATGRGAKALAFAKRQLGDRYGFGGNGPNRWDCSGLTRGAWKRAGVKLPHNARAQYKRGKKVAKRNLRKGDLVFFYSDIHHVAIYAGNGKVIHAPRPGKRVSYIKMKYMPYKGARRPG